MNEREEDGFDLCHVASTTRVLGFLALTLGAISAEALFTLFLLVNERQRQILYCHGKIRKVGFSSFSVFLHFLTRPYLRKCSVSSQYELLVRHREWDESAHLVRQGTQSIPKFLSRIC